MSQARTEATDDGSDLLVGAGAGGGALKRGMYGNTAAALDRLALAYADTTSAHSVLNALAYAFRHDVLGDVETALEPLVDEWLEASMKTQEQQS